MSSNLLFIILLTFSTNIRAFKFTPMNINLQTEGRGKSQVAYIENDSSEKIAIQIKVATREILENGKEVRSKVEDKISIFPRQMILKPKEKRTVRIRWNGPKSLKKEKSFRVIAEQLPIEIAQVKKKKTNIKILLKYSAALYVTDNKFKPDVLIKSVLLIPQKKTMRVFLENTGTAHQVIYKSKLKIVNSKTRNSFSITGGQSISNINILAKTKRYVDLPLDKRIKTKNSDDLTVKLIIDEN